MIIDLLVPIQSCHTLKSPLIAEPKTLKILIKEDENLKHQR